MFAREQNGQRIQQRLVRGQANRWRTHDIIGNHARQFLSGAQVFLQILQRDDPDEAAFLIHHRKKIIGVGQKSIGDFAECRCLNQRGNRIAHEVADGLLGRRADLRAFPVRSQSLLPKRFRVNGVGMKSSCHQRGHGASNHQRGHQCIVQRNLEHHDHRQEERMRRGRQHTAHARQRKRGGRQAHSQIRGVQQHAEHTAQSRAQKQRRREHAAHGAGADRHQGGE